MQRIKTIVWDWNGTLLNDVDININIVNKMLKASNIRTISKEYYRSIFSFPITEFYISLGFKVNESPSLFFDLVRTYNKLYHERLFSGSLFPNVKQTLQHLKESKVQQIILSGQNQTDLDKQVDYFSVRDYFELVKGSEQKDASDKKEQLAHILNCKKLAHKETMIIGDTVYDWALATSFGMPCVLFSHGHQNEQIVSQTSARVFPSISKGFLDYLLPKLY